MSDRQECRFSLIEEAFQFIGKFGENEVDGEDAELGFLEVGLSRIEEHEALFGVPPCGAHELDRKVLSIRRDAFSTRRFQNIANLVLGGLSTPEGGLGNDESIAPGESDDPDVIAEHLVLQFETTKIFRGQGPLDPEFTLRGQDRNPGFVLLVLLDPLTSEPDDVLGAAGVDIRGLREFDRGEKAGFGYRLPLGREGFETLPAFDETRSSSGVCATNCARDITREEERLLASLICWAIFLWISVFGIAGQDRRMLAVLRADFHHQP